MSAFTTQSLGELKQSDSGRYEPVNQNQGRFVFLPSGGNEAEWVALIDGRVPGLNENWRAILARDSMMVAGALAEGGLSYEDSAGRMSLRHLTLHGDGRALLEIALSESEAGLYLEVDVSLENRVSKAFLTR